MISTEQSFSIQAFCSLVSSPFSKAFPPISGLCSTAFGLKKFLIVTSGVVAFVKVLVLIGDSGSSNAWLTLDESFEGPAIPITPFCFS